MDGLRVECRSDARGERVPARFGVARVMQRVVQVVDCWPGEGQRSFRVRTEDGAEVILRHDERAGRWELVALRRAAPARG